MAANQPSVKKNYMYRLLYEIMNIITPLITAPYFSRILEADGIGICSYTSSIMAYFTMFAALGTASYGAREIARKRDDKKESSKAFFEIELMKILTSMICIGLWGVMISVSKVYQPYFLALLPQLLGTMLDISWYFTGLEKIGHVTLVNTITKLIGIVCLFVFVRSRDGVILYILINSLMSVFGSLAMWIFLPKMVMKISLRTLKIKKHLITTLKYFIPTVSTSIYTILDKTLIGVITNDNYQNGYYEQATKIVDVIKAAVFAAVNTAVGARISYLFKQKKYDEIHNRINKSINLILLLGIGAVFGIWGVADKFVPIFFGEGYEPVVKLLYMMTPLVVIMGISNCLVSQYYIPAGLISKSSKYIIMGSCVNIALNLCLIPLWGVNGAVIASLGAEIVIMVLYMLNCNDYLKFSQIWRISWKKLIAGLCMYLIIVLMQNLPISNIYVLLGMNVIIGIVVYSIILLLLRDSTILGLISMSRKYLQKKYTHF